MIILALGILFFCAVHLALSVHPALASTAHQASSGKRKGIVSIVSIVGIALIIFGWRSAEVVYLWQPAPWTTKPAIALVVIGVYLFVVAQRASKLKRILRHPQLIGLTFWAAGHLLANGDNRSLLLFTSLLGWSIIEIFAINRRNANAVITPKVEQVGIGTEVVTLLIAVVAIVGLISLHQWFSGVPLVAIAASF